jgi:hypothetical protein
MPTWSLPRSLADLLIVFGPCFTAPTFGTFCALVTEFLAQPGRRTVTGMLAGAPGRALAPRSRTGSSRQPAGRPMRSACCWWT